MDPNGLLLCCNRLDACLGKSPLSTALGSLFSKKKYAHVRLLLQYKANVNIEGFLLYILGFNYDALLLRLLVKAGFNMDKYSPRGLEFAI